MQIGDHAHAVHVAGIHSGDLVQVCADNLEQILDRSIVAEAVSEVVELFPIDGVLIEVIQHGTTSDLFVQPCKISGHAEIAPGASHDRGIVRRLPWPYRLSGYVVGGMMLMHSGFQPDLNEVSHRKGVEQ